MEGPVRLGFVVALGALEHDLCGASRVWIMAPDTIALVLGRMRGGDVFVAPRTGRISRRPNPVRLVAIIAIAVLDGRVLYEDQLSLMA